jgi:gas vesicle protein GvpL/GvpF
VTLTYVYCLVRSSKTPAMSAVPAAMPGGKPVRALPAGSGAWLIVSDVPASRYDEAALATGLQNLDWVGRRAVAHEAVVEHFLAAPAVLPMQLFTLFTSDARALEHIARTRRRLDRILTRLERQQEWGLRLSFDERGARQAVEDQHRSRRTRRAASTESGAAYLTRKRDLMDVTRGQLTAARREADQLYRAMSREATEARRRKATEQATPGSRLLLDAAFLVPSRRANKFRGSLRQRARTLSGSGLVVSLTGPWPPYNFVDAPRGAGR